MIESESYEVQWRDGAGVWRSLKHGLTIPETRALVAEYKGWTIRVLKAIRTEIRLVDIENDSQ